MVRIKRGTLALKNRRYLLKRAKGFRLGRSKKAREATDALQHAGMHAFAHRRKKKGDFRRMWTIKMNAIAREFGSTYSKLINLLQKNEVQINRKILSEIAETNPEAFKKIMEVK